MSSFKTLLNDWPDLSRLLDDALDREPVERAAWLAALSEPDSVKQMLRDMLADATSTPGGPTDTPPRFELDGDENDGLAAGGRIGAYRLIRELGRGGMGVVWLAERDDGELRREVALKLPHLGWSAGLNERMRRERDILASLAHAHIARIHDAGVDEQGRPYLALEYVEGQPIDVYCRERRLPTERRLNLLLQVARAVAHAHGRLVVHRDLKPANILVTAEGEVRLLDFGIAQLLEGERAVESSITRQVGHVLTLDYASPEQLRGAAIGTSSDLYSLAVVAYEVLTEHKPYRLKRMTAGALEEAIVALDVPPASSVTVDPVARRALRGDVDAILNKALKKDAGERYASVEAFAQDIERSLARRPVRARPDGAAYRMRRFVARNAIAVTAGTIVVFALVGGSAVALWQARAARLEATRAEQVKNFALSIVDGANTGSGANRATTAVDLLEAAKTRVDQELSDSPQTAVELLISIGTGLQSQGRTAEAVELFDATRRRAARELGIDHPLTLAATIGYGVSLVGADRPKEAIAVLGPAASAAAQQHDAHAQIEALFDLSTAQLAAAQADAGVVSARAAVAALQAEGGNARPLDAFDAWLQLSNALNAAQQPGITDAAERAVRLGQQLYGDKPTGDLLSAKLLLSRGLTADGRDAEALAALESLYADEVRLFGPSQPRIEAIANFLGLARADAGDLPGAEAAFRAALAVGEQVQGGTGGNRGIDHFTLGRALAAERKDEEALGHLQESVRLLTASVGATTAQTLRSRSVQAAVLVRLGRLDQADAIFTDLATMHWPAAEKAQNDGRAAQLRSLRGRHDEAVSLARSARDALKANPSKIVRATAEATLGQVLLAAGRADDALPDLREADRLFTERQKSMTPDHALVQAALARASSLATAAR